MEDCYICCCCGQEHDLDEVHEVEIKGENKKICKECVTAVKGLI